MRDEEKKYTFQIQGTSPLIMQNCEQADPQNHYSKLVKKYKSKKNRTETDEENMHRLTFCACLYWSEELDGIYMPTDNIRKMIFEAGKKCDLRKAKELMIGFNFDTPIGFPLKIENRTDMDKLADDPKHRYKKIVNIQKAKVPITRAIFRDWSFDLTVNLDLTILDFDMFLSWLVYAGKRVGIGIRRPLGPTPGEYGRFQISEWKEEK